MEGADSMQPLQRAARGLARGFRRAQREPATVRAARRLNLACGTIALSVLLDSGLEHYRGAFRRKLMYLPPSIAALTILASLHGRGDTRPAAHRARQALYLATAATGVTGTALHIYNILKRPGRLSWQNLFYGAPFAAPMAILLSGVLGAAAEEVRHTRRGETPRVLGVPAGRLLAAVTSLGLTGSSLEAAVLHFRGAYHNPAMYAPVTIPPAAAALMADTARRRVHHRSRFLRAWMRITAAVGMLGAAFHVFGVHRNMGGWRNWSQNLLNGPPIPAPPAFTGLALAGLAAIGLLEEHPDA
jgi:hypothetical protein